MFCPNCGNQNPDNSVCCGYCGAKLNNQAATPVNPGTPIRDINGVVNGLQNKAGMFLAILAVVALLATIFWFTKTISVNVSYGGEKESETATMAEACEEDFEGMNTVFTITTLVSTVATMGIAGLNFVKGAYANSRIKLGLVKIASIIALISMIIPIICLKAEYDAELFGAKMSVGPSFTGVLFILCTIAMFVLATLAENETKKTA